MHLGARGGEGGGGGVEGLFSLYLSTIRLLYSILAAAAFVG